MYDDGPPLEDEEEVKEENLYDALRSVAQLP